MSNGHLTLAEKGDRLVADLDGTHTLPLWAQMAKLNPPAPNPRTVPHVWRYDEIRPYLIRAGEAITEKQAERRVLMLVNPARDAPYTTDTLYAGLQLVMPHETAPAHRHVAFAMRFIIEGHGGFTAVHGRRVRMQRGDVILTPTWHYHDHGKDGSDAGPMIWLDGLDLPQFRHFPVHFVEHYAQARYPAEDVDTARSPIVFPWERMKGRLDAAEGEWAVVAYEREGGRAVSRILGGSAERIDAGGKTGVRRETCSSVYHVVEGSGFSLIDGRRFEWKRSDTFCVPAWNEYQHFAGGGETVYLYRFDDKPMIEALGFYRKAGDDIESYVEQY
ncbi:putative gentisate 1,2-dioxygenase [Corynespora cassiicola Philippines]|uniref:Putative gentisate 1,2-dioxygenase n=1 Tax=Corynespora cassiicola Philippines TaxID=1448308 RepID=A0A2T2N7Q7_CORCC|nr:putative gentisate 1,2-dioxygenase [Corynespora cassiicola Philippines]